MHKMIHRVCAINFHYIPKLFSQLPCFDTTNIANLDLNPIYHPPPDFSGGSVVKNLPANAEDVS